MLRPVLALGLSLCIAAPVAAQTFRAEGRVDVTPVAGGFSVKNGGGLGARGMWCAAADYARDVLGARGTQRIYVAQNGGRKRGPVVFTMSDAGLTPSRVTIIGGSERSPGASLSVDHAHQFCVDHRLTRGGR